MKNREITIDWEEVDKLIQEAKNQYRTNDVMRNYPQPVYEILKKCKKVKLSIRKASRLLKQLGYEVSSATVRKIYHRI